MEEFFSDTCPACGTPNLVSNGDTSDQTVPDTEGYNCWKCGALVRLPFEEGSVSTTEWEEDTPPFTRQAFPVP